MYQKLYIEKSFSIRCIAFQTALRDVTIDCDMTQEVGDITYALKSLPINLPGLGWRGRRWGVSEEILGETRPGLDFFFFLALSNPPWFNCGSPQSEG